LLAFKESVSHIEVAVWSCDRGYGTIRGCYRARPKRLGRVWRAKADRHHPRACSSFTVRCVCTYVLAYGGWGAIVAPI